MYRQKTPPNYYSYLLWSRRIQKTDEDVSCETHKSCYNYGTIPTNEKRREKERIWYLTQNPSSKIIMDVYGSKRIMCSVAICFRREREESCISILAFKIEILLIYWTIKTSWSFFCFSVFSTKKKKNYSFHFSCGLVFGVTHFHGQNGFCFSMVGQKCKTPLFLENKSLHSAKFSFYTNKSLNSFKGSTMLFLNFKGWNRAPLSYCQKQLSLNITNISSPQTTTTWMFLSSKHILYLMVYKSTKLSWELSRA